MTWLLEDPWPVVVIAVLLEVVLIGGLYRTGRGVLFAPMILIALLAGGLFALEQYVVTEKEEIEEAIYGIAASIEADNVEGVLAHISEAAPQIRNSAERHLRFYFIEEIRIKRNLEVFFRKDSDPRRAEARFNAVVVGGDRAGLFESRPLPLLFTLEFRHEDNGWKLSHYEVQSPQHGRIINADTPERSWGLPRDTR